jgi:hypothetical protein
MKSLILLLSLLYVGGQSTTFAGDTNGLARQIQEANFVGRVRVTSIWTNFANISSRKPRYAACALVESLKGYPENSAIRIGLQPDGPPPLESGKEYIVFLVPNFSHEYFLLPGTGPYSQALCDEIRAYVAENSVKTEPSGAANRSQPLDSETNRAMVLLSLSNLFHLRAENKGVTGGQSAALAGDTNGLARLIQEANFVAHIRVTNIWTQFGTPSSRNPREAKCDLIESLKGYPMYSVFISLEPDGPPALELGKEYIAFLAPPGGPGVRPYLLLPGTGPYSQALCDEIRAYVAQNSGKTERSGAANQSQPSPAETNRAPGAAGSGR